MNTIVVLEEINWQFLKNELTTILKKKRFRGKLNPDIFFWSYLY